MPVPPKKLDHDLLAAALEAVPAGVILGESDPEGHRIKYVNSAYSRITGYPAAAVIGQPCRILATKDEEAFHALLRRDQGGEFEGEGRRQDGTPFWYKLSVAAIAEGAADKRRFIAILEDITAARDAWMRLRQSESQLRTIMLSVREGIQLWDRHGCLVYANPAAHRLFNAPLGDGRFRAEEILTLAGWTSYHPDGQLCRADEFPVREVLQSGRPREAMLIRMEEAPDRSRWLRIHAYPIPGEGGEGPQGVVTSSEDVSVEVEQEQRLRQLAHYDPLTQLPNRVMLANRMHLALAESHRNGNTLAVCLLDLDGFKPVNDTHGHKAGDQLLREVAQRLQENVRGQDTVARLGGDEFALLIGGLSSTHEVEHTLQRLLKTLAQPYNVAGTQVRVSASIGVTLYPSDAVEPDRLLRHADQAMYQAKQAGKNRYALFDPRLDQRARANRATLRKIDEALGEGQFELFYQPIVDCRAGRVLGAEVLARWRHPILGLLAPGEFLPLIEHDDLVVKLGFWAIGQSLRQLSQWQAQGIDLNLSVNISARQLHRKDFAEQVRDLIEPHPTELRKRLRIEIVETAALEDINAVSDLIREGHALGLGFALDDFGTGYSSLIHLKRLGVDALKIDHAFIADMLDDPMDLAIVEGIIGLASAFRCQVVAEGVESIDHILMLLEIGCDIMQGFGLARPMPASELSGWLQRFQPDPRWRLASSARPSRRDFEWLLAKALHQQWAQRILAQVENPSLPRPPLDSDQCRIGQWLELEGRARYGQYQGFIPVMDLHRQIHRLGKRLAEALAGRDADALALAQVEFCQGRDALTEAIDALRAELAQTTPYS